MPYGVSDNSGKEGLITIYEAMDQRHAIYNK